MVRAHLHAYRLDPVGHADTIHCNGIDFSLPAHKRPHDQVQGNQVSQEKLRDDIAWLHQLFQLSGIHVSQQTVDLVERKIGYRFFFQLSAYLTSVKESYLPAGTETET